MEIVIIGIGSMSRAVSETLNHVHNFHLAGFIGTIEELGQLSRGTMIFGRAPFLGDHSLLEKLKAQGIIGFFPAIGDNQIRESVYYKTCQEGLLPVNILSPMAYVSHGAVLSSGIFVGPGSIISTGVHLGNNNLIDAGAIIDIDSQTGDNCYLQPGAVVCGGCTIERNVSVGPRAVIEKNLRIGKNQKIPAGQRVSESLPRIFRTDIKELLYSNKD